MEKVIKRDSSIVEYDNTKIFNAITKANKDVSEHERISEKEIYSIISNIEAINIDKDEVHVESIQDSVEQFLMEYGKYTLAKAYILYRYKRGLVRESNTTDESILSLIRNTNKEVMEENSNKNATIASTQRDLIAGEVSKDLTTRLLLPKKIVEAHKAGTIHFHDADYFLQPIFNCCLINIGDMLDNGTVMNGKMIESPRSFQVACTVTTQIIAAVASSQYGGQSVDIKHLGKYLRRSRDKYIKHYSENGFDEETVNKLVNDRLMDELKAGIQTIQYQINTLMTTNGQSPFVTLFLNIPEDFEYQEEAALIVEEIIRQRLEGIKNEEGVYITPAFPKLVYPLYEHNNLSGGKYDHITKLAAKCTAKRLYPDYISAKKMKETYEGNVFSCMGCRSFLSPWQDENGNYKFEGRFNMGVVTINLPQIGLVAKGDENKFWSLLNERLNLCKEALLCRYKSLLGTTSDISPIHWQYGAIARLKKGEKIDHLLQNGYATISLGYIGLYECTYAMKGMSHCSEEGEKFAIKVMKRLKKAVDDWKAETGLGFGLYGSPAESTCYTLARKDKEQFGSIENITDKDYYTNSYHVDVREKIDAFTKFEFESQFQEISTGGCISYVEIPNLTNNVEVIEEIIKFIYDTIQYGEFNTKSSYCHICGGSNIEINDEFEWECLHCGNKDHSKMNVAARTCGYIGENFWNAGKTKEIASRVTHI